MSSDRKSMSFVSEFFSILGAAVPASAAVRSHKTPSAMDLRILGIEPTAHVLQAFRH